MKRYLTIILMFALLFAGCKPTPQTTEESPIKTDTVEVVTALPDTTIWGYLGEDTGMSTLQFITDQGDTLEIYRTSQYTGEDGRLLGEVRNLSDRFAITLAEGGETLLTAINATQLAQEWDTEDGSIDIKADGSIESTNLPYNGWKLWNGHILLTSQQQREYGKATRIDTMDIEVLDEDSLIIRSHINQLISFSKK
ncbi:MAG: hypothetical protein IJ197_05415 [Bacteroidaceae bacterium]|nr:hypothetical protein [Bacteroidaceae bacterium]